MMTPPSLNSVGDWLSSCTSMTLFLSTENHAPGSAILGIASSFNAEINDGVLIISSDTEMLTLAILGVDFCIATTSLEACLCATRLAGSAFELSPDLF